MVVSVKWGGMVPGKMASEADPLCEPHRIAATDRAAPQYLGIDADDGLGMLGRRAENTRILGEVPLG